jgi:hypothetical protein
MLVARSIAGSSDDGVVVRSKALLVNRDDTVTGLMYRDVVVRTTDGWRITHKSISRPNRD